MKAMKRKFGVIMENSIDNYFDPFEKMTFSYENCFLCGCLLNEINYSEEHVVPKWLQRKFNLWNRKLILLNGTSINYKDLKIPCCKKCNNAMSKNIENPIEQGVSNGYNEFVKIDEKIIFQWLNKMSYGFLFKELSLKAELSNPNSDSIYKAEYLREHEMQYLFLKSLISNTTFVNNPWSIIIFKINPDGIEPYWAYDNPYIKTFCIRMNDIGIIAHLMDNGYNKGFFMEQKHMRELLIKTLHPIQFAELSAMFIYISSLFYRDPFNITVFDENLDPNLIIANNISGHGYKEWKNDEYAHILASFLKIWGLEYNDVYIDDKLIITYLRNEDGSFKDFFADL